MNRTAMWAIFKRNFSSYFANPTGYVFICVFVLLSSYAAFWPDEFFATNLANLDQLNGYLPLIMLVFIPAISMSIWAEERRQGTDELLLTIPAGDLDVVLGKYLAAVAIFSVSLLFSLVCNYYVLWWLGNPDIGLFLATYIGYWMVGLTMLSIGMVASFLTGNLTVGFVLGAAFNVPLVIFAWINVNLPGGLVLDLKDWSLANQMRDFSQGVISFSNLVYFFTIIAVMLYLSMVLISRRHWGGARGSASLGRHYFLRTVALLGIAAGVVVICQQFSLRADITEERLSSLSPRTKTLVRELAAEQPVQIEAYISPEVPESYVQTRLNLISTLHELDELGGKTISVRINDTDRLSDEAERAEQLFGITGRQVATRSGGTIKFEEIFLGVGLTAGLDKVTIPFLDRGVPIEYELVRSICTVNQQERRKLGVLSTDAQLFGGFDQMTMRTSRNELIIDELEKQYEVVQVNADAPITEKYDVLLAVQPSTLSPAQMENFVAAVRGGQATAIFEDPFPYLAPQVAATSQPRRQPQMNPFMGGREPELPKGNINELWTLLGVDFSASKVIWQKYNPYPKFEGFPLEFVFIDSGAGGPDLFNQKERITSDLQQLLFLFCGAVTPLNASPLEFTSLVSTGDQTGTVRFNEILQPSFFGQGGGLNAQRHLVPTREKYVLAAQIRGKAAAENLLMSDAQPEVSDPTPAAKEPPAQPEQPKAPEPKDMNVVLVADIDMLYSDFFMLRAQGQDPNREFNLNLDNVTFVLNVLDVLAGDDRFVEVRKRRPVHRTLTTIEEKTESAREDAIARREEFISEFDEAKAAEQDRFDEEIKKLQARKDIDPKELIYKVQMAQAAGQRRLEAKTAKLEKKRDKETDRIERELRREIDRVQDNYKLWAVVLPPIPPLLVGLAVFFSRRAREREGVARARLR